MKPATPLVDLSSLQRALASLQRALVRWEASQAQDEELRDAQNVDAMSFRDLVRTGAERGLLRDVDAWMVFRDNRNITSHSYNAAKAAEVAVIIPSFALQVGELLARLERLGAADD